MLVLSRKVGESIKIGKDVVITVTDVKGSTVQIGIEAPRDIKVYRQEVADRIDSAAELTTALE